jgi:hypothetical protein
LSLALLISDVDLGFPLLLDFSLVVSVPQLPPGEVLSPSLNASGFLGSSPLFPFSSMAELIRPTSEVPKVVLMSSTPLLNDLVLFWSDLPRFAQPLLLLWFWVALMISSLWHPLRRQTLLPSSSHHLRSCSVQVFCIKSPSAPPSLVQQQATHRTWGWRPLIVGNFFNIIFGLPAKLQQDAVLIHLKPTLGEAPPPWLQVSVMHLQS